MKVDWDELKRLHAAIGQSTKDNYLWSAAIEAAFPAILAEREAAQKSMMLLTQSRDRCIAENVRLAERLVKLDPGNCFPMKLNAAFDKETQNEG